MIGSQQTVSKIKESTDSSIYNIIQKDEGKYRQAAKKENPVASEKYECICMWRWGCGKQTAF